MTAASIYFFQDTGLTTNGVKAISQTWMNALGFINAFADQAKNFVEGNIEAVIKRDPDVLILTYGYNPGETCDSAKHQFVTRPGTADMKAVRNNRIACVPSGLAQNDPGAVSGLELIARELGITS